MINTVNSQYDVIDSNVPWYFAPCVQVDMSRVVHEGEMWGWMPLVSEIKKIVHVLSHSLECYMLCRVVLGRIITARDFFLHRYWKTPSLQWNTYLCILWPYFRISELSLHMFPILVRQLFWCLTAFQLIQKKLLFYFQGNRLLLPKLVKNKLYGRDIFPR